MRGRPRYWLDPWQRELETEVVETGVEEARSWAILGDTILYPSSGGQPSDRGSIDHVPVIEVVTRDGAILHFTEQALPPGPATVRLDWPRRFDHMQQHSAQHLLTAVAATRFGWPTTAFHLGPEVSDIELATPRLGADDLRGLEDEAAEEIREARPITARFADKTTLERAGVRSRGLPEDLEDEVRLVQIDGLDVATCGGTHLASTAQIESLCLLGAESLRGGSRVFFIAGGRVRHRMAVHEDRAAALRSLLDAPDEQLAATLENKLDQLQAARRESKRLLGNLAEAVAKALAAQGDAVVSHHFSADRAELVPLVARRFAAEAGRGLALLTADSGSFAVACGGDSARLPALGAEVASILDGRGGGAGGVFQGKAGAIDRRDEAVRLLEGAVRGC